MQSMPKAISRYNRTTLAKTVERNYSNVHTDVGKLEEHGLVRRTPVDAVFVPFESVGEGESELRVDIGCGYRVYYGKHGQALVILLCGGDKGSQQSDITRAKTYWADWKRRNS